MTRPTAPDPALVAAIRDTVAAARKHLDTIERHLPEALRRAAIPTTRDGYPRRASGAPPATSTTPTVAHHVGIEGNDDESALWAWCECGWITQPTSQRSDAESWAQAHEDEHASAISYSDPTGEACATQGHPRDDVTRDARRARTQLDQVVIRLDGIASLTTGITKAGRSDNPDDDLWCSHHLRLGMGCTPAVSLGLCDFCTGVKATTGRLPHRKLLERHDTTGRVTTKDL
jgi:hypothetical protein